MKKFCHEVVLWKRLDHPNIASVLGVTIDPYQVVFPRVSDKDITQHITDGGVDRVSLVSFIQSSRTTRLGLVNSFPQISDIAEGLGYLHSRNIVHGRLRTVSPHPHLQRGSQLTASEGGHFRRRRRSSRVDRLWIDFYILEPRGYFTANHSLVRSGGSRQ